MAKDSDKLALLAKRKRELDHAIKNELGELPVAFRVEKLKLAALAVLKKDANRGRTFISWDPSRQPWSKLSVDDVIEITRGWPSNPTIRDLELPEFFESE